MANGTLTGANGLTMGDLLVRLWRRREAASSPEMSGVSLFKEAAYSRPRKIKMYIHDGHNYNRLGNKFCMQAEAEVESS